MSVHIDYDTADLTLNDLLHEHVTVAGDLAEVSATIDERAVGDLTVGTTTNTARAVESNEPVDLDQPDIRDDPFTTPQPEPELAGSSRRCHRLAETERHRGIVPACR